MCFPQDVCHSKLHEGHWCLQGSIFLRFSSESGSPEVILDTTQGDVAHLRAVRAFMWNSSDNFRIKILVCLLLKCTASTVTSVWVQRQGLEMVSKVLWGNWCCQSPAICGFKEVAGGGSSAYTRRISSILCIGRWRWQNCGQVMQSGYLFSIQSQIMFTHVLIMSSQCTNWLTLSNCWSG